MGKATQRRQWALPVKTPDCRETKPKRPVAAARKHWHSACLTVAGWRDAL
jgi:hypothetical protein